MASEGAIASISKLPELVMVMVTTLVCPPLSVVVLAEIAVERACSITTAFDVAGPVHAVFPDRMLMPVAELVTARVPGASDDRVQVKTIFEPGASVAGPGYGPARRLAPPDPANRRVAE